MNLGLTAKPHRQRQRRTFVHRHRLDGRGLDTARPGGSMPSEAWRFGEIHPRRRRHLGSSSPDQRTTGADEIWLSLADTGASEICSGRNHRLCAGATPWRRARLARLQRPIASATGVAISASWTPHSSSLTPRRQAAHCATRCLDDERHRSPCSCKTTLCEQPIPSLHRRPVPSRESTNGQQRSNLIFSRS